MFDPYDGHSRARDSTDRSNRNDFADNASAWLLVALAAVAILGIAWFGVMTPQNNQETAATRIIPATTDLDTTGRSGSAR